MYSFKTTCIYTFLFTTHLCKIVGCLMIYSYQLMRKNENAFLQLMYNFSKCNIFFTKLLQVLPSTDSHTCNFSHFSDNVPFHDHEIDHAAIDALEQNFSELCIRRVPQYSGTTSLIFVGFLEDSNGTSKKIAVKIKKVGFSQNLIVSYNLVFMICFIIDRCHSSNALHFCDIWNVLYQNLSFQDDFMNEIDNLEYFQTKCKFDSILIPNAYRKYTEFNDNLIILDFVECVDISTLPLDMKTHACKLISAFNMATILKHSAYHCDMHNGNMKYSPKENKLVVLDFGIVGYLTLYQQKSIAEFMQAIITKSDRRIASCIVNRFIEDQAESVHTETREYDILDESSIEKELHLIDEICVYIDACKHNTVTIDTYHQFCKLLDDNNYKLNDSFSRLYLSLIITHVYCTSKLQIDNVSEISSNTLLQLYLNQSYM